MLRGRHLALYGALTLATVLGGAVEARASGRYQKSEEAVSAAPTSLSQPRRPEPQGPTLSARSALPAKGDPLKDVTEKQIGLLQNLSALTSDDDPEKPELLFQLAQLFEERARYYNFQARQLDEEIFRAKVPLREI